jgi:hypothetical protein
MKKNLILIIAAAILYGCAVEVKTIQSPSADFSGYKSFCWLNGCEITLSGNVKVKDTTLQSKLKRALTLEMKRKGFKLNAQNPDLLLGVYVTLKDERSIAYKRDDETPLYWQENTRPEAMYYTKGTVVVTMADQSTGSLVWESTGVSYMEFHSNPSQPRINHAVGQMLKKFPPKKSGS